MLVISTTEPYTLDQFQKALAELAEELPGHTAEGTAIKKRFLDLAKATVVWKYIDARALRATKKDKEIFSLLEYRRHIYNLAMTYPTQTECSEVQWIISNIGCHSQKFLMRRNPGCSSYTITHNRRKYTWDVEMFE